MTDQVEGIFLGVYALRPAIKSCFTEPLIGFLVVMENCAPLLIPENLRSGERDTLEGGRNEHSASEPSGTIENCGEPKLIRAAPISILPFDPVSGLLG